jgi:hypothetical protein
VTGRPAARSGRALLAEAMSEDDLEESVRGACAQLGVYRYHPKDSRRSEPGWPDDVLVGPGGILYRELKSEAGTVGPEQSRVIGLLRAAGADVQVWRPRDWVSGRVAREIAAIARPSGARAASAR